MLKTTFWVGLLILLSASGVSAQFVVNTTGGSVASGNERLDYSIGEIATSTITSAQNQLTQGVLQPLTILVNANELFDKQFTLFAFPNPVKAELIVETDYTGFDALEIFDLEGRSFQRQRWVGKPVDFQSFPPGSYFVRLYDNTFAKTIKIIKQ